MDGYKQTRFFDLPIANEDRKKLIEFLFTRINLKKPLRITTMNAQIAYYYLFDPRFKSCISESMVIPDGIGLLWAVKSLNTETIRRYPGIELAEDICKKAGQEKRSVYLLGGEKGVAEKAANYLIEKTGVEIKGFSDGYFQKGTKESTEKALEISACGADILFVALGAPLQEKWLKEYFQYTGTYLSVGVGGAFDVFAGEVRRAPKWVQKANLEWLYRILQSPRKKFKVIFQIMKFIYKVLNEKKRQKRNKR